MKALYPLITGFCCLLYGYQWYNNQAVPAWAAFIWCFIVFCHDIGDYVKEKYAVHDV